MPAKKKAEDGDHSDVTIDGETEPRTVEMAGSRASETLQNDHGPGDIGDDTRRDRGPSIHGIPGAPPATSILGNRRGLSDATLEEREESR